MGTALRIKDEVSLAVECFNAIHYKLLRINVNHIDKLTKEIRLERLNTSLQNIHELGFNPRSHLKMTNLAKEAKILSAMSYTTPLQEVFRMNPMEDDKDLAYFNATTDLLQEILMTVSLTMQKLFPTNGANEELSKFILIDIK